MKFVTIATADYSIYANRLIKSIVRTHPQAQVTVYADRIEASQIYSSNHVEVRVLDEIAKYGVKRAKFFAYADASRINGFVYLDSDILVRQPLTALLEAEKFTACRDDLRECPFIANPAFPWAGALDLSGENYFNSGVFGVPPGFADFFDLIRAEAADDHEWERFTIPGKLYDNHFLCAKVAQYDIPVNFVPEYEYNWQGYRSFNRLECYVDHKGELRNRTTGKLLRLVHFAGIKDIDAHIAGLPVEIAKVLADSIGEVDSGILELINSALNAKCGIEPRLKVMMCQAMCQRQGEVDTSPGSEIALLGHHASIASVLQSVQETDILWNDLKCGSAYLSAAEYQRLRAFVVDANVHSVLEFGAGYTTTLFARLGCRQVALEGWDGPWLEFARSQGADARLVSFTPGIGFDEDEFVACIEWVFSAGGTKLVFIDSPPGTANRSCVVNQLLRLGSDADYYALHDSVRDSSVVYNLCSALGLMVIDHFQSIRGLTFLGKPGVYTIKPPIAQQGLKERVARMRFDVRIGDRTYASDGYSRSLFIHLTNTGDETITAVSDDLMLSMHLMDEYGQVLHWDTPRYRLPVDLQPGDCISFKVDVGGYFINGATALLDFVKEGDFWWSDIAPAPCPRLSLL